MVTNYIKLLKICKYNFDDLWFDKKMLVKIAVYESMKVFEKH